MRSNRRFSGKLNGKFSGKRQWGRGPKILPPVICSVGAKIRGINSRRISSINSDGINSRRILLSGAGAA